MHPLYRRALVAGLLAAALCAAPLLAISASETDDFEAGLGSWQAGGAAPGTFLTNPADGGPTGAGDAFMQIDADGVGPGGKITVFNRVNWTGDYGSIGPAFMISMDILNTCGVTLTMRLGVSDEITGGFVCATCTRWVSDSGAASVPDSVSWQNHVFTLNTTDMSELPGGGSASLAAVLGGVAEMRLLHSAAASWVGDDITCTLGVDNIQVIDVPVELQSFSVE